MENALYQKSLNLNLHSFDRAFKLRRLICCNGTGNYRAGYTTSTSQGNFTGRYFIASENNNIKIRYRNRSNSIFFKTYAKTHTLVQTHTEHSCLRKEEVDEEESQ